MAFTGTSEDMRFRKVKWLSGNSRWKHLVDGAYLFSVIGLEITNGTNKRIPRMLKRNKIVSFVRGVRIRDGCGHSNAKSR